jgi:hypothetical protein
VALRVFFFLLPLSLPLIISPTPPHSLAQAWHHVELWRRHLISDRQRPNPLTSAGPSGREPVGAGHPARLRRPNWPPCPARPSSDRPDVRGCVAQPFNELQGSHHTGSARPSHHQSSLSVSAQQQRQHSTLQLLSSSSAQHPRPLIDHRDQLPLAGWLQFLPPIPFRDRLSRHFLTIRPPSPSHLPPSHPSADPLHHRTRRTQSAANFRSTSAHTPFRRLRSWRPELVPLLVVA